MKSRHAQRNWYCFSIYEIKINNNKNVQDDIDCCYIKDGMATEIYVTLRKIIWWKGWWKNINKYILTTMHLYSKFKKKGKNFKDALQNI